MLKYLHSSLHIFYLLSNLIFVTYEIAKVWRLLILSTVGIAWFRVVCTYFHIPFYLLYARVNVCMYEKFWSPRNIQSLAWNKNLVTRLSKKVWYDSRKSTRCIYLPNTNPFGFWCLVHKKKETNFRRFFDVPDERGLHE